MPYSTDTHRSSLFPTFPPFFSRGLKQCAALGISLLLAGAASQAANSTWTAPGGGNYFTTTNWAGDIVPNYGTSVATFGNYGGGTVTLNGGVQIYGITFGSDASAYTFEAITNQYLQLNSGASIQTVGTGSNSQVFTTAIAMLGPVAFTSGYSDASRTLAFNGTIFGRNHGSNVLTLNGANQGANTVRGNIINGDLGTTALVKDGSGTWVVSGSNSYTGTTTINGGTLLITGTHTGGAYTVQGGVLGGAGGKITTTGITLASTPGSGINISGAGLGSSGSQNALTATGTLELSLGSGSLDIRNAGAESLSFVLTAPDTSDRVHLSSGTLNIGNGLLSLANFDFDLSNWGATGADGTYILFSTASTSGIVGSLAGTGLTQTRNGYELTLSLGEGIGGVLDLRLEVAAAIPEPSAVAITLGGLAAWVILKRRRQTV